MPYRGRGDYRVVRRGGIFGNLLSLAGHTIGGFLGGGPVGAIVGAGKAITGFTGGGGKVVAAPETAVQAQQDAVSVAVAHNQARRAQSATKPIGGTTAGTIHGPAIADQVTRVHSGKHRRMNWANGRALGRAERRIHAAVKHMSKYIKWVHPKKDGHAAPHFGRKRRK